MHSDIAALFLDYSTRKLDEMTASLDACFSKLTEEQIWQRSAAYENTIGNLVLHLCGNMRQWVLHGVGGAQDVRTRDLEFSTSGGYTRQQLLDLFHSTVAEVKQVIAAVPHERLTERITPQGRNVAVLDAIYQVVGHVQQHLGQIILLTKQMAAQDLDLTLPRPR
ncbi:MAG: DinB family protein [Acidobacteriaceae bacterium]